MKKKYSDKISKLEGILKKLFPEYVNIKVINEKGVIVVTFIKSNNKLLQMVAPKLTKSRKSLYELLVTAIPTQLSYRKARNSSFSYIFLLQIAVIINKGPHFIIEFLEDKLRESSNNPETTMSEVFEEANQIMKAGLEDLKIFRGILKVSADNPIIAKLIANIID